MEELTEQKCEACRVGAPSVTADEIKELQPQVADWKIIHEDGIPKLDRHFKFKNFKEAIAFSDEVGAAALPAALVVLLDRQAQVVVERVVRRIVGGRVGCLTRSHRHAG